MIISIEKIPEWIKKSELYKNFSDGENEEIKISKKLLKNDDSINSIKDFKKVFNICRFWGIDYPPKFYLWAIENKKLALKYFYSNDDQDLEINNLINKLTNSDILKYKFFPVLDERYDDSYYTIVLKLQNSTNISFFFSKYTKEEAYYNFGLLFFNLSMSIKNNEYFSELLGDFSLEKTENKILFQFQQSLEKFDFQFVFNLNQFNKNKTLKLLEEIDKNINALPKFHTDMDQEIDMEKMYEITGFEKILDYEEFLKLKEEFLKN